MTERRSVGRAVLEVQSGDTKERVREWFEKWLTEIEDVPALVTVDWGGGDGEVRHSSNSSSPS